MGSMKDPNLGICPMTTSSHTLAGFGTVGGAVPPTALTDIITVTKAYSSAVGAGAFVSELFGAEADELRRRGGDAGEFGATTGRPRPGGLVRCRCYEIRLHSAGGHTGGAHRHRLPGLPRRDQGVHRL